MQREISRGIYLWEDLFKYVSFDKISSIRNLTHVLADIGGRLKGGRQEKNLERVYVCIHKGDECHGEGKSWRNRAITTLGEVGAEVDAVLAVFTSQGLHARLRLPSPFLRLNANESDLHLIPTDLRSSPRPTRCRII